MSRSSYLAVMSFLVASSLASADNLSGSQKFLCSVAQANVCTSNGECSGGLPWEFNIPNFIEVDLDKKLLSTTQASGENRSTQIKNLERVEGLIVFQGFEQGRAFSFLITEDTGLASIAVARDGVGVVGFGACTPR